MGTLSPSTPFTYALFPLFALIACGCQTTSITTAGPTPTAIHWEPWSDDVFVRAHRENKLVLMDLEAVWCHWCHVMDEVTYQDPKVVALINQKYIAVKVDQDSRPDISNKYEDYGWPATVVFTSTGGELAKRQGYVPPNPMAAMLKAFIDDPTPGPSVKAEERIQFGPDAVLASDLRKDLEKKLAEGFDEKQAGWGTIHKFVDWDIIEYSTTRGSGGDAQADERAHRTLTAGLKLIDPVWGGAYQYSTDADWDHPHFEKLTAFQASLLRAYSLAYARYKDPQYLAAAQHILDFVASFLTSPQGAVYVSQDADVTPGEHSADYFALDDAGRRKVGIPRVDQHVYSRENGLAIEGLVAFYSIKQDPRDLAAAITMANWIISNRTIDGGGFKHDQSDLAGPYLADTLAMARAFLALYSATADRAWLARAEAAAKFIGKNFHSSSSGSAGFVTAVGPATGPLSPRPELDENVAAARFFNLLGHYTGNDAYKQSAKEAMRYLAAPQIANSRGLSVGGILLADIELANDPLHVTVVGAKSDSASAALFQEAIKAPTGYKRIEWWDTTGPALPNPDVQYPQLAMPAAFLCTGGTCSSPMFEPQKLASRLAR